MQLYALEYNSERENLIISEHGRHVQKLINHAITIEDRSKRQRFVESVVNLMHQMNPQTKNVAEYKERLWKHVFRISDYKLDVDAPEGVLITKPSEDTRVANLEYPKMEKRFRHYGRNVQELVRKALTMEIGEKRDAFVEIIGSYMKLAYRTWNREHYVNDEIIMADLRALSKGELVMSDDITFNNLKYTPPKPHNRGRNQGSKNRNNNNRNNRNSNNRNNNNRNRNRK